MVRILLVDDQNIILQGLQALLESKLDLEIVGTADDGEKAIKQVEILAPDIALVDIEMPRMDGLSATRTICQQFPRTKVLVLSSHTDEEYIAQALKSGAKGYLLKSTLVRDLEQAIWSVHQGSLLEPKPIEKVPTQTPKIIYDDGKNWRNGEGFGNSTITLPSLSTLLQKNGISLKFLKWAIIGLSSVFLIYAIFSIQFLRI